MTNEQTQKLAVKIRRAVAQLNELLILAQDAELNVGLRVARDLDVLNIQFAPLDKPFGIVSISRNLKETY